MTEAPADDARNADFIDQVDAAFRRAAPLNRFICDALELDF